MKVLIEYSEIQYKSYTKEVEMTAKEYAKYCKMSQAECEESLEFCSSDIAGPDYTETHYEFTEI
jgi:hypothetical protein